MNELRLLFDKAADGLYTARLVNNWGGNASEPAAFTPFLDDDDFESLRWYLEDYMDLPDGGSILRARSVEDALTTWGRRLFGAVFDGRQNTRLLDQLLDSSPPRVLTVATGDPGLLRVPWELMADERGPLTRREVTIRRQLETAGEDIKYAVTLPLRILLVVSRPGDLGFIDPRLSARSMLDALDPLGDDVQVDFCRPPTLRRLEEMLRGARRRKEPYHIVHFDGHGARQRARRGRVAKPTGPNPFSLG